MDKQQAEDLAENIRRDSPIALTVTIHQRDEVTYVCQVSGSNIGTTEIKSMEQWIGLVESGLLTQEKHILPLWATPQEGQTPQAYYIWERNAQGKSTGKTAGPFSHGNAELVRVSLEAMAENEVYTYEITPREPEVKRRQKDTSLS